MGTLMDYLPSAGAAGAGVFNSQGAIAQGKAIKKASSTNAKIIRGESAETASRMRRSGEQEIGRQRAILGASGVQSAGTPLELIARNASEIERSAMETQIAGEQAAQVELSRGDIASKQSKRISAAALLEGGTRAAYYGRQLL